jgi:hypothetical protein
MRASAEQRLIGVKLRFILAAGAGRRERNRGERK